MAKKSPKFLHLLAEKIAWFMGSWLGLVFHLVWWLAWFWLNLPMNLLTFLLSVEAILIGIFILMVQNEADHEREKLLNTYNRTEMKVLKRDLKLAEKAERRQLEIGRHIRQIQKDLEKLKSHLK